MYGQCRVWITFFTNNTTLCHTRYMNTNDLAFTVPTIYDVIDLVFFQVLPFPLLGLVGLYAFLKKYSISLFKRMLIASGIVISVFTVWLSLTSRMGLIGILVYFIASTVFVMFCSPIVLIFHFLYNKQKTYAVLYVLTLLVPFILLYPKTQVWSHEPSERYTIVTSCDCIGFSEGTQGILVENRNGFRCFGLPVSCYDEKRDVCPWSPDGEKCNFDIVD